MGYIKIFVCIKERHHYDSSKTKSRHPQRRFPYLSNPTSFWHKRKISWDLDLSSDEERTVVSSWQDKAFRKSLLFL